MWLDQILTLNPLHYRQSKRDKGREILIEEPGASKNGIVLG